MRFFTAARKFQESEDGAVTVDWVVLTAAVVGLVFVAMAGLRGNMNSVGAKVEEHLRSTSINTTF
jgi:hypothetical protein